MGYRQFLRSVQAAERRQEREALRRHRELVRHMERQQRAADKEAERQRAAYEVKVFENYLDVLVSVHKDCGDNWDWAQIVRQPAPEPPTRTAVRERAATERLTLYRPNFFERVFGGAKKQEARLKQAIMEAQTADEQEWQASLAQYREATSLWEIRNDLASRILKQDTEGYRRALKHIDAFAELELFRTRMVVDTVEPQLVMLSCFLEDEDLVPKEELKLTAGGKVSTKDMPAGRYWMLHQDFVCSCALRAGREVFAALPVNRTIVNTCARRLNTSTGHMEMVTLLAVHFTRNELERLNFNAIDPSDSMKNFHHRMKFKKTVGFEPVDAITPDDQWVST